MLYQPTNISPSMLGPLGNGVIDANEDFVLSFQVNGNSPLVRFELFIVGADEPSQLVSGRTLEQPFYGTDYAGNVQMFHANLESLRITNGKSYKLRIRQYWSETEYVDQQSQSTFITRDRPTISFLGDFYDGNSFSQKSVTFRAKYTQKQGDGINWVRWRIAEEPENYNYETEPENIIRDTGNIYGTAQLQYTFDGIFPGKRYLVQCIVQSETGMENIPEWFSFSGDDYQEEMFEASVTACTDAKSNGVRLILPEASSIEPSVFGTLPSELNGELFVDINGKTKNVYWYTGQGYSESAKAPFNFAWCGSTDVASAPIHLLCETSDRKRTQSYFSLSSNMACEGTYPVSGSGTWRTVVCGYGEGKLYMALGDAGVAYSRDAKTWTMATIPAELSRNLSALSLCEGYVQNASQFFLVSSATTAAAYTADGVTWTSVTMDKPVKNVFFSGGRFFASYVSGGLAQSDDLSGWLDCEIEGYSGTEEITGVSYGNEIWVCLYGNGKCATTDDLNSWESSTVAEDSTTPFYGLCFLKGKFFARDNGGEIYVSENGSFWSIRTSYLFQSNASGNNTVTNDMFLAVGSKDQILISADGGIWNAAAEGTTGDWKSGCFDGENFVFVGGGGKAAIFHLCVDFKLTSDRKELCSGKIYANERFTLVLDGKKLYTSSDYGKRFDEFPADFQWTDDVRLREVNLANRQTCYWMLVSNGNLTENERDELLNGTSYTALNFPTYLYTNFWGTANAGQYGRTGYSKLAIYRQEGEEEAIQHVGDITVDQGNVFVDASAVNGRKYTYYAYGVGESYSAAIVSGQIQTCGWDWHLLACTKDDAGAYHVQKIYRFGKNLSSGSVSNNAVPSVLQNFTRYPVVQNSPWNYRSGMLTSMIGYTENGVYFDNTKLRDEIAALTTSGYALFLKNRKGDVIHIAISGAIEMETMDNSAQQAQTVKLPWVEIADASSAQIIITKNDGAFLQEIPSVASEHGIDTAAVYFG